MSDSESTKNEFLDNKWTVETVCSPEFSMWLLFREPLRSTFSSSWMLKVNWSLLPWREFHARFAIAVAYELWMQQSEFILVQLKTLALPSLFYIIGLVSNFFEKNSNHFLFDTLGQDLILCPWIEFGSKF